MRSIIRAIVALAVTSPIIAQPPATVTANVSTVQPASAGTATFTVQFVDASLSSTIDSALGVLGGAGVVASHLTEISVSLNQGFVITQYDFTLNVPASQFTSVRDKLIAAQRSLANVNTQGMGWSTSYTASSEDTARALQQALPGLLAQAKQQAGVLASAIGMTAGAVQSISAPTVTNTGLTLLIALTVTYALQ